MTVLADWRKKTSYLLTLVLTVPRARKCLRGTCLFEMYVSAIFVIRRLYSAVSLTQVREQRFIRIIYYIIIRILSTQIDL